MTTNLFFELLQMALGMRDHLSRVPTVVEWEEMYDEAVRQSVASLMVSAIERLPAEQSPPIDIKYEWIGEVQLDEANYRTHCERAAELTKRCWAVGFRSCVLKGVGMAQYYPEPSRRLCGDIDFLVDGRRKDVMAWLQSQYEIGLVTWHHAKAMIFDDVKIEIHMHPAWMYGPSRNRKLQRFFDDESDGWHDSGLGFNVPGVQFDAVFSLVHTFHHFLEEGVGLRHVVDYFYVLKKCHTVNHELSIKKEDIMKMVEQLGMKRFVGAMMYILNKVCGMPASELLCEPNEKEGRFLLSDIIAGGNFGKSRQDGKGRNTVGRWMMMVRHYPSEVLWMVPWKVWHWSWRMTH